MPSNPRKAQELRNLAEALIKSFEADPEFQEIQTEGLVTSLVRQWMTYDGHAALVVKSELCFLPLTRTPLGAYIFKVVPSNFAWREILLNDWRMAGEDLPNMVEQFNRGQSAEGTNLDGEVIRWWVNPKERAAGVDGPPINKPPLPLNEPLLIKFATSSLMKAFSGSILEHEIPVLAKSVAKQWKTFGGFASIMTENEKISLRLERKENGSTNVQSCERKLNVRSLLQEMGVPPDDVIEAIARLNLGQVFHFVEADGNSVQIWDEPHKEKFFKRTMPGPKKNFGDPFVCPSCGGVLGLWKPADTRQKCNLCGHICQRG